MDKRAGYHTRLRRAIESVRPAVRERVRGLVRHTPGDGKTGDGPLTAVPYECAVCETSYSLQYHVCPECGSYSVELKSDARARLAGAGAVGQSG